MYIELEKSSRGLSFMLIGEVNQIISDWEYSIDKKVFEEQLSTGLFNQQPLDEDLLAVMKLAKDQNNILPYYGADGSRGVSVYTFLPIDNRCQISINHSAAKKPLELSSLIEKQKSGFLRTAIFKYKISSLPNIIEQNELSETSQSDPELRFHATIVDNEYTNLKAWQNWDKKQPFSGQFQYSFGRVSMGSGFTTKVKDLNADQIIDITDYGDW